MHFVIYWLFQNGANKNQHQDSYQRETVPDKFVFFSKLIRQKKVNRWAKYVNVCEWDMCWRNFCNFPLVTRKCEKYRSEIALFSNECHFEIWFPKKRKITFFWSKLSKLHKKDPILHVAATFSLKQGETGTSHGLIPHPLMPFNIRVTSCRYELAVIFTCRCVSILPWAIDMSYRSVNMPTIDNFDNQ